MRTRKILLTTTRDRVTAIVRDGAVVELLEGPATVEHDHAARRAGGTLVEITRETRMVKAKQLTFAWEVVRRVGKQWIPALRPTVRACAYCQGRGLVSPKRPCRKCKGEGAIAKTITFPTRARAIAALRAEGAKGVARKVR